MRPFFFDTFHERIARWPLNVEATIRAAGIGKVLAIGFVLTHSPVVGILTGVFLKLSKI